MRTMPSSPQRTFDLWAQALAAPWLAVLRPQPAGRWMLAAPRLAWAVTTLTHLLLYAALVVAIVLWEDTSSGRSLRTTWQQRTARQAPWWCSDVDLIVLAVLGGGAALLVVLAWLNLPLVHRTGPVRRSLSQTARASAALLGPVFLATLGCFGIFATRYYTFSSPVVPPEMVLFTAIAVAAAWFAYLSGRVVESVPSSAATDLPPRCEGCGYDLTHVSAEGRCTECGRPVCDSLVPGRTRWGSDWAARRTAVAWVSTACEVLFRPTAFYGSLQVRRPLVDDRGFARVNYALLAVLAGAWVGCMFAGVRLMDWLQGRGWFFPPLLEILLVLGGAVLFGTIGCWLGQRIIAAIVFSVWLAFRSLADYGWAAKVVVYESAFVWAFATFWGLLITSIIFLDSWISRLFGGPRFTDDYEALAVVGGSIVLGGLWLIRYAKALWAIRWANY